MILLRHSRRGRAETDWGWTRTGLQEMGGGRSQDQAWIGYDSLGAMEQLEPGQNGGLSLAHLFYCETPSSGTSPANTINCHCSSKVSRRPGVLDTNGSSAIGLMLCCRRFTGPRSCPPELAHASCLLDCGEKLVCYSDSILYQSIFSSFAGSL
jgi:hypothetical protein